MSNQRDIMEIYLEELNKSEAQVTALPTTGNNAVDWMLKRAEKHVNDGIVNYVFKGVMPSHMHAKLRSYSETLVNGTYNNGNIADGQHLKLTFSQWAKDYKVGMSFTDLTQHPDWAEFIK